MSVKLNHTIVAARDKRVSAAFLSEVLGLPAPIPYGPFLEVEADNEVILAYMDEDGDIQPRHYAFLVGEDDFDAIFGRIEERAIPYYADPAGTRKGEINHNDGGRGCYFPDPDGHWLEIITRAYGSGE